MWSSTYKPLVKFERLLETYLAYAPSGLRSFLQAMPIWLKEKLFLKDLLKTVWLGDANSLQPQWEIDFPHSLGLLYSTFTYFTGFKVNSGEYKLMGLAPYSQDQVPRIVPAVCTFGTGRTGVRVLRGRLPESLHASGCAGEREISYPHDRRTAQTVRH